MNMCMHILFIRTQYVWSTCFQFWGGINLGVELLGLCLTFWGTSKLLTQQLNHFVFPPAMYWGLFFYILANVCYFLFFFSLSLSFSLWPSLWVWSGTSLWFWFVFPTINKVEQLFVCLLAICMSIARSSVCWIPKEILWRPVEFSVYAAVSPIVLFLENSNQSDLPILSALTPLTGESSELWFLFLHRS